MGFIRKDMKVSFSFQTSLNLTPSQGVRAEALRVIFSEEQMSTIWRKIIKRGVDAIVGSLSKEEKDSYDRAVKTLEQQKELRKVIAEEEAAKK